METRTKQWIGLALVAAVLFTIAPAAQAAISLPTVDSYRLVFQTSVAGSRDYTVMADFDAWVTGLAQASGAVDDGGVLGTTWNVIGATEADSDILTRTNSTPGTNEAPIYLVDGTLFAADYATFWSDGITITDNPDSDNDWTLYLDEYGNIGDPGGGTHTGLTTNGVDTLPILASGEGLDSTGAIRHGGGNEGYNQPATPWYAGNSGDNWNGGNSRVFVISDVIPEPATMSLLAIGGIALLRRKRK